MNTPSHAMHESPVTSQGLASVAASALRPMYWSLRRELWENRWLYIAPLAAAVIFLIGFLLKMIAFRYRMHGLPADSTQQGHILAMPYEVSGSLIMGVVGILGIFYTLDALYGERRDRSILFWKSLPVSDLTVVLSKMIIPLAVLPVLSLIITCVTNFIMLLLASTVLLGSGSNIAALWTQGSFFHVSFVLFYHIVTVHGLWYAPIYGWLLLVSAAVPRAPFVWALLPPFVICVVEKVTFNTWHFATLLKERLIGTQSSVPTMPGSAPMDPMANLIPHHFLSEPGLWIGLAVTAVFLAATVRLRRYRGPL